jgi:hypothetical protein
MMILAYIFIQNLIIMVEADSTTFSEKDLHQHQIWNNLVKQFITDDGFVDYQGFKSKEHLLNHYLEIISTYAPTADWTRQEKIAYWINAYNAFTVKLMINHYGVQSIKDIQVEDYSSPWKIPFFKIGEDAFTLDKIEHEILRKEIQEPYIHFALVCASFSCPHFRNEAYTAQHVKEQLDDQARIFINDPRKNKLDNIPLEVSSLFSWYWDDFANYFTDDFSFITWLNKYSNHPLNFSSSYTFMPYNCSLNGK